MSILSGILLALSFPPLPFSSLVFIAFVPYLVVLESEPQPRKPLFLAYLLFFFYHGGTNWWISSWQPECDPYLLVAGILLAFVHPFFFMVPIAFYRLTKKKLNRNTALWLLPFYWTTFEWLRAQGDLAYPWLSLGNTQVESLHWIQFVDITGVWGATFLIMIANVAFTKIILYKRQEERRSIFKARELRLPLIFLAMIIIVPIIYSYYTLRKYSESNLQETTKRLKTAVIQPNINPWIKWNSNVIKQIELHGRIQDSLIRKFGRYDLAVWTETSVPFMDIEFNSSKDFNIFRRRIDFDSSALLTGFSYYRIFDSKNDATKTARQLPYDPNKYYEAYNSALMLNPGYRNHTPQLYFKSRLTPFSERLPFIENLLFLRKFFEWGVGISSWGRGTEIFPLIVKRANDSVLIGQIICIESVFPDFSARQVELGASVLAVITNDAWYDHTFGPIQHYSIGAMRAMETRRYLIRCANSGISGVIAPSGATIRKIEQYKATGFIESIPLLFDKTFYVNHVDWLPFFCSIITIIGLIFTLFKKYFVKMK
ncbi:MAG: Apolipoprotein N-acyltransferase [Ignavibacteria bacterium]|nr:Apolipoprotein N-acyltransferase [Ignavibacteria bacterium]